MGVFLQADNIVKHFSNHQALNDVSINVNEGSIFGLLGPNGAGKTTLLRIINQITAQDSGEILILGHKIKPEDVYQIGYLPEERGLYKKMKVGEQAVYLARLKGLSRNEAIKQIKYWFEKFEIQSWWNKKVEELSKGMQQKLQFITTVVHRPKLLIFDEPFSGFDPINANLLKQEIINLRNNGATVIFSTHNMESVEELCDDITLIHQSKNILSGEIRQIKHKYKSNSFRIEYKGDPVVFSGAVEYFSCISDYVTSDKHGISSAEIKLSENFSGNDLIKSIIDKVEIISFNEIFPSMNEIFIKTVMGEETRQ